VYILFLPSWPYPVSFILVPVHAPVGGLARAGRPGVCTEIARFRLYQGGPNQSLISNGYGKISDTILVV
jgi:hypothetical protein